MRKNSVVCLTVLLILMLITSTACKKNPATPTTETSKSKTTASSKKTSAKSSTTRTTKTSSTTGDNSPDGVADTETPDPDDEYPQENGSDGVIEDGIFAGFKFDPNKIDCGGKTYLLFTPGGIPVAGNSPEEDRTLRMIAKTEEKFNVKIDYVVSSWWNEVDSVKALWLSGIKWADGPFQYNWVMPWGLTNNLFQPIDDYIDFTHERFQDIERATRWIDGKHHSFLDNADLSGSWIGTTFYNTAILQEEGLEDILGLYKSSRWTWEKFREYAIIATRDINGDGVIDQWGCAEQPAQANTGLANLLRYSNTIGTVNIGDGTLSFNGYEKAFINALQFYQTLKYVDKVIGSPQAQWLQGKSLMILNASNSTSNYYTRGLPYKQAPLPVGPDAEHGSIVTYGFPTKLVPAITDFKPEELIAIGTYLSYNDPDDPLVYMDPYDSFMLRASNPSNSVFFVTEEERLFFYEFYDKTMIIGTDSYLGRDFNTFLGPYLQRIGNGEGIVTVLDSLKPSAISYIDELMAIKK